MGAYQPRARRAKIADSLEDFRQTVAHFLAAVFLRASGLLLLLGALAGLLALATYNPVDASLDNATGRESLNWLQGPGATAADLLLQLIGLAAYVALGVPAMWGALALSGKGLARADWRALAWPTGTVLLAAGLGGLPSPLLLPAGAGGLVGLATFGIVRRAAQWQESHWLVYAIPMLLLVIGAPLAFFATGLRLQPILRGMGAIAFAIWRAVRSAGSIIPSWHSKENEEEAFDSASDPSLDVMPEPVS